MLHIITEENSQLIGKTFLIPNGIKKHLVSTFKSYDGDKTVDGYKRLKNLIELDRISYNELRRIKNFFDNYVATTQSSEYILNGGDTMKYWVDTTLDKATKAIRDFKYTKKNAGFKNAFIKPHTKSGLKTNEQRTILISKSQKQRLSEALTKKNM